MNKHVILSMRNEYDGVLVTLYNDADRPDSVLNKGPYFVSVEFDHDSPVKDLTGDTCDEYKEWSSAHKMFLQAVAIERDNVIEEFS